MKRLILTLGLPLLAAVVTSAHADSSQTPAIQDYAYDQKLDIATVYAMPDLSFCGVKPVVMKYMDHQGEMHALRFEANGNACLGQN